MLVRADATLALLMILTVLCVGVVGCSYNLTPDDERRFQDYRNQNRSYG